MKLLHSIFLFLLFFSLNLNSQSGYFNEIRSTKNTPIFGEVGCLDQDSLYFYAIVNSGYSTGGFCSGGNGTSYIVKISKATGKLVWADSISGMPYVMKTNDGIKVNNSLYIGGQLGDFTQRFAFVAKYNLSSRTIDWQKVFNAYWTPTITEFVTQIRYNKGTKKLFLTSTNMKVSFLPSPLSTGVVDTTGTGFLVWGINPTFYIQMQNLKFDISSYNNYCYGMGKEIGSRNVCLFKNTQPNFYNFGWVGANTNVLNITTDSTQYSCVLDKYILNVAGKGNDCICILSDTLLNVIRIKQLNNFRFKSGFANGNIALLTGVTAFDPNNGDEVLNLKIDTSLSIIASKKLSLNPFNIHDFSSRTFWDGNSFYNVISTASSFGGSFNLYKSNFSVLQCNETNITVSTTSVSYTSSFAAVSSTATVTTYTPTLSFGINSFKDSLNCPIITTSDSKMINTGNDFHFYPNPSNGMIEIRSEFLKNTDHIVVTDLLGVQLKKLNYEPVIDLSDLNSGVYFIQLYREGRLLSSKKLIKSN